MVLVAAVTGSGMMTVAGAAMMAGARAMVTSAAMLLVLMATAMAQMMMMGQDVAEQAVRGTMSDSVKGFAERILTWDVFCDT